MNLRTRIDEGLQDRGRTAIIEETRQRENEMVGLDDIPISENQARTAGRHALIGDVLYVAKRLGATLAGFGALVFLTQHTGPESEPVLYQHQPAPQHAHPHVHPRHPGN